MTFDLVQPYTWHFSVQKKCADGTWSEWSSEISTELGPFCIEVEDMELAVSYASQQSAELVCNNTGYQEYHFRWRNKGGTYVDQVSTEPTVHLPNLQSETTYEWKCKIKCDNVWGYYSSTMEFRTSSCDPPVIVRDRSEVGFVLTAQHLEVDQFRWSWKESAATIWKTNPFPSESLRLSSVAMGSTYHVRAKAVCGNDGSSSDYSDIYELTIPCDTVGSDQITFENLSPTTITIKLNLSGANRYSFSLDAAPFSDLNPDFVQMEQQPISSFSGLQPNTWYRYRIGVTCQNMEESQHRGTFRTPQACEVPSAPVLLSYQARQAIVSSPIVAPRYQYRIQSGAVAWQTVTPSSSSERAIGPLEYGQSYQVQLRILCRDSSWSDWSSTLTVGLPCQSPLAASLLTSDITAHSAILSHEPATISGPQLFRFRTRPSGHPTWFTSPVQMRSKVRVDVLHPMQTYEWQCQQICDSTTWSSWSVSATFQTSMHSADDSKDDEEQEEEEEEHGDDLQDDTLTDHQDSISCEGQPGECFFPPEDTRIDTLIGDSIALLSVQLEWPASWYQFRYRTVADSSWNTLPRQAPHFVEIDSLKPGEYAWSAQRGCPEFGESGWSDCSFFFVGETEEEEEEEEEEASESCLAPGHEKLVDSLLQDSSVHLICQVADYPSWYQFRYASISDTNWIDLGRQVDNSVYLDKLDVGTYHWQAKIGCPETGESPWSDTMTFQIDLSTPNLYVEDKLWSIYPNPAQDKVTIELPLSMIGREGPIRLYDLHGRQIRSWPSRGNNEYSLDGIGSGWYVVVIDQAGLIARKRLLIN